MSQEKEFSNCDIYDVWNQQRRQGKKELLDVIKAFFGQVGVRNYVLYYSGHGEEDSGNWVIGKADMDEVEVVTFEEILLLWKNSPAYLYKQLLIISDSCHSGRWVEKLNQLDINVHMYASCRSYETCTDTTKGGDFTRLILEDRRRNEPELDFSPIRTRDARDGRHSSCQTQ